MPIPSPVFPGKPHRAWSPGLRPASRSGVLQPKEALPQGSSPQGPWGPEPMEEGTEREEVMRGAHRMVQGFTKPLRQTLSVTFVGSARSFRMTQRIPQYMRSNTNLAVDKATQDGLTKLEVCISPFYRYHCKWSRAELAAPRLRDPDYPQASIQVFGPVALTPLVGMESHDSTQLQGRLGNVVLYSAQPCAQLEKE